MMRLALAGALLGMALAVAAQQYDVLAGAPRTSLYLQADYTQPAAAAACDWHASGDEYLVQDAGRFGRGCRVILRLTGTINRAGAAYFMSVANEVSLRGHSVSVLALDSRGGDADASIDIAQRIRRDAVFDGVLTRVADGYDAICFSGCVIVFAAGYRRVAEFDVDGNPELPSRLGIHSPGQYDRASRGYDSSAANREIGRIERRMKAWFRQIGVDAALVDDMFEVPFDGIRLLSQADFERYGLAVEPLTE